MQENLKKIVLPNDVRVLLIPRSGVESVLVEVVFDVGSCHETPELGGAAHYLEHLAFRGTEGRPSTAQVIFRELDRFGADYNASTGRDQTKYYVRLEAEQLPFAVDLLADMTLHPLLRPEDIEAERGPILEEARGASDDPEERVTDALYAAIYPHMALGRPIIGTLETISSLDRDRLLCFRNQHYLPERTVISVVGKFDEAVALSLVEKSFGNWHPGHASAARMEALSEIPSQPQVVLLDRPESERANIAFGFRTYGYGHPRMAALDLLALILGGSPSSRLFVGVRGERGLAYSVGADTTTYRGTGLLTVSSGINQDRLEAGLEAIIGEMAKLKTEGVTEEELHDVKTHARGQLALATESSRFFSSFYGNEEMYSLAPRTLGGYLADLSAVTQADLLEVARDIFKASALRLIMDSPFDDPEPYLALAAKLGD